MLRNVRQMVFETNSSSTHSLSIVGANAMVSPSPSGTSGNKIVIRPGEYGWGFERLYDCWSKLSYIVTAIQYHEPGVKELIYADKPVVLEDCTYFKWLSEMVQEYTGRDIEYQQSYDKWYPHGYIDHQSMDLLDDYFVDDEVEFKNNMRDVIFNNKYQIIIDNDNH